MGLNLWIDGKPAATIAPCRWGALTWSHAADGGCKEATWQMGLPLSYAHPSLTRGKIVEIKAGPMNVFKGLLTVPNVDADWTFTALGLGQLGHGDYLGFDSGLNTTSTPDVAIDQAIARGLPWKRPTSLSNVAFAATDSTSAINYVGDLLDAWATSVGKRWGVDADGNVWAAVDPTVPTWHLTPGVGRFGLADDDYASHLYLRYLASGVGYATAVVGDSVAEARFGRREKPVDLTPLGILTSGQATTMGTGLMAKGGARQGYTNGLTVTKYQITTPGGTPAFLPFVKGGQMVRQFGVLNEQGQPVPYVDWVIGETHLVAGQETIGLDPVGIVARDLGTVLADLSGAA